MRKFMMACVFAIVAPQAAFAAYGAIAYSPAMNVASYAHGYGSANAAIQSALAACAQSASDCRTATWGRDGFLALAISVGAGPHAYAGVFSRFSIEDAYHFARNKCLLRSRGIACVNRAGISTN